MLNHIQDKLKSNYNSSEDNVAVEFYNRVLSESILYKRVSGYFSSKALALYSTGLENLDENEGKVQFIISSDITLKDFNEIKQGYELRSSKEFLSEIDRKKLGNLAYLISKGMVDFKFGFVDDGLFHSKWGLFEDIQGNVVYINGSANETHSGLMRNYDSFDVDFSWDTSTNVRERIKNKIEEFDKLWCDENNKVKIVEVTELVYEVIKKYNKGHIQKINSMGNNSIILDMNDDNFFLVDNTTPDTQNKKISDKRSFFSKIDIYEDRVKKFPFLKSELSYIDLLRLISKIKQQADKKDFIFKVSDKVNDFINKEKYSIDEYRKAGYTIKNNDKSWENDINQFRHVVNSETERNLKNEQINSSFFMLTQKRAANFSVPGSGKTAMTLGVFAFLNRREIDSPVKRMFIVCPLNAFMSWEDEFRVVFGKKKELKLMNIRAYNNERDIEIDWYKSNLILVNYESLSKNLNVILRCLSKDSQTMLVLDEVHRVKNPEGQRAFAALKISEKVDYKYVLTGTPIPNSYQDIYNMLHILYKNEYNKHFGFDIKTLKAPDENQVALINEKIAPYFWRTNKKDLDVPPPEEDIVIEVEPSEEQLTLAEYLYNSTENHLTIWIRMLQLSTLPELLNYKINYNELGMSEHNIGEISFEQIPENYKNAFLDAIERAENIELESMNISNLYSPKFEKGIEIVLTLVSQGKKVVVWGLFVKTLKKITEVLSQKGVNVELIYGGTSKENRDNIIKKFKNNTKEVQVLVSNPNTLGESVSLHKASHDAVYFEYNYNLTFMLQSRDRIHRLGLEPSDYTRYYYLMTSSNQYHNNFIDKKIYERLMEKASIMEQAIDGDILVPSYTDDMIDFMKETIISERGF